MCLGRDKRIVGSPLPSIANGRCKFVYRRAAVVLSDWKRSTLEFPVNDSGSLAPMQVRRLSILDLTFGLRIGPTSTASKGSIRPNAVIQSEHRHRSLADKAALRAWLDFRSFQSARPDDAAMPSSTFCGRSLTNGQLEALKSSYEAKPPLRLPPSHAQATSDACNFVDVLSKDEFLADKWTLQAVIMSLIIIGEVATKVMDRYAEFARRNREIHGRTMLGCETGSRTAISTSTSTWFGIGCR